MNTYFDHFYSFDRRGLFSKNNNSRMLNETTTNFVILFSNKFEQCFSTTFVEVLFYIAALSVCYDIDIIRKATLNLKKWIIFSRQASLTRQAILISTLSSALDKKGRNWLHQNEVLFNAIKCSIALV